MKGVINMLKYSLVELDDNLQILLKGDLDIESTEIINDELIPKILSFNQVNLNFKHVPFVDSSGMGLLLTLFHAFAESDTRITISNVREDVFEIFELLQIPKILGEDIFV